MSKAILVVDMPSSCSECPCCYVPRCEVLEKSLKTSEIYECKPDWCPLREVPEKKDGVNLNSIMENCKDRDSIMDSVLKQFIVDGYNACIDEILKGSEEHG